MTIDPADEEYVKPSIAPVIERYVPREWVFPVVLALFVAVFVWFGRSIYDFLVPGPNTVTVPSFVGQPLPDTLAEIDRLHLKQSVVGHAPSDRFPKGVIISQEPQPGMQVREGRQISLVTSDGVQTELMPDVRFQSLRDSGLDLARARLQLVKTTYVRNDDIPPDHVIDQDPPPLASVTEGTAVTLTVSRGGSVRVKVPSFAGMSIGDARKLAQSQHIRLGQIVWTPLGPYGPAHGEVVRQKPAPGTELDSLGVVSLQVSAGPHESGYIVHQVHVLTSVPVAGADASQGTQALHVLLRVTDATGTYDLYDAYASPGQKLDFTLTTLGTSVLEMFVNGNKVSETRLGVEPPNAYATPGPKPAAGATVQ